MSIHRLFSRTMMPPLRQSVIVAALLPLMAQAAPVYNVTALGTLGGFSGNAFGINAAGQVVGPAGTANNANHAFLYQNGAMQDLGTLGGTYSIAHGINAAGQVVGYAGTANNAASHAFLYQNGAMQDLGTLGGTYSVAHGINAAGQVVGQAGIANDATHAFLYQNGAMTDLNALIDASSGWRIVDARGINDLQQIAAYGCKSGVGCQPLRLDLIDAGAPAAVPEPGSAAILLSGVLAMAGLRRRKAAR